LRTKLLAMAACVFLLLTIVSVTPSYAVGEGEWITKYRVVDASTNEVLMIVDFENPENNMTKAILPGASLEVTFTVNVVVTGGTLKLSTSMQPPSPSNIVWSLTTVNYTSNFVDYNPTSRTVEFTAVKGTFDMVCYGKIRDYPASTVFPVPLNAVTLTSAGGDVIDQITLNVVNAAVDEFQKLLEQKEAKLQSLKNSGVAAGYVELYGNIVEEAQAIAEQGDVEGAMAVLNALSVSSEPASSFMEGLYIPIIGVLAALAVAFLLVFMRSRGKVNYFLSVIEDQIKDLEGLTLRASKIDRTISSSLESIKDRLMRLVGA
jgi:hypothetical protein